MKCNIGIDVDKKSRRSGGSWVLRNDIGKVIMHSRRAFSNVQSLDEAKYQSLLWTLECLSFHHLNRVIIAMDDTTLTKVILIRRAWPNFRCQYVEMKRRLRKLEWWRLVKEDSSTNRAAFFIAQSAARAGLRNHMWCWVRLIGYDSF